jgi:hypothetical protein
MVAEERSRNGLVRNPSSTSFLRTIEDGWFIGIFRGKQSRYDEYYAKLIPILTNI